MKYKLLGNSGLRVSELCLGTMTFGKEWGYGADYEESKKQVELFAEAGGNFIDTANRYTEGTSERYIGEIVAPDRDRFVIASKYTLYDNKSDINSSGNHRKNMIRSVEESLKRLNTPYLDVLYLHIWDFTTPVEEILRGMDDLVRSGKTTYVAISDTPAWVVAKAQTISEYRHYTPLLALQCEYSLIQRTPERDLIPMADHFGMSVTAWAPLAGGALSGKYVQGSKEGRVPEHSLRRSDRANAIVGKVIEIAGKIGCSPVHVALNWLRGSSSSIIPVIGARSADQLKDSLSCINYTLEREFRDELNEVSKIELGFPHDFLQGDAVKEVVFGGMKDRIDSKRLV